MRATCPMCKTSYLVDGIIPPHGSATLICQVCETQLEVIPRGAFYLYRPLVLVRQSQRKKSD
jgi:transcription elongation factor Elf1